MGVGVKLLCTSGVLLAGAVACAVGARPVAAPGSAARTVVVAELFTSEGCSSCPPADDVLSQLVHRQPIPGVEVLALGEHVDYWERLGWRDPFSSAKPIPVIHVLAEGQHLDTGYRLPMDED